MNRSKTYIFIIALIAIMVFGAAAVCNLCGVPISVGETGQSESEDGKRETTQTDSGGSNQTTQQTTAAETPDSVAEETPETPAAEESISEDTAAQESAAEPVKVIFHADPAQTGLVAYNGMVDRGNVFVGYMGGWGIGAIGYVSFYIRELEGKNLESATLIINVSSADVYNPKDSFGKLILNRIDWGHADLHAGVKDIFGSSITSFDNNTTSINYSGEALLNKVKSALLDSKRRIQFSISYEHPLAYSGNTTSHGFRFNESSATLEVTYLD